MRRPANGGISSAPTSRLTTSMSFMPSAPPVEAATRTSRRRTSTARRVALALIELGPRKGSPMRASIAGTHTTILFFPLPFLIASRVREGELRMRGRRAWMIWRGVMCVALRYFRYSPWSWTCSSGARAENWERLRRETTECTKGCVAGEACGSPWKLMGNLWDSVEAKERRKMGIVAGYHAS